MRIALSATLILLLGSPQAAEAYRPGDINRAAARAGHWVSDYRPGDFNAAAYKFGVQLRQRLEWRRRNIMYSPRYNRRRTYSSRYQRI